MPTSAQRQDLIETIRTLPARLAARVRDLTPAQLTTQTIPGEWTVAQIVHHLADSHTNSIIRMKLMLTEDHPTLRPYDQERWALLPDGTGPAIQHSLALLAGLHQRWVLLFENLSDADWQRTGLHPEIGPITVADILQSYAQHGEDHLDQIERVLAAERDTAT